MVCPQDQGGQQDPLALARERDHHAIVAHNLKRAEHSVTRG